MTSSGSLSLAIHDRRLHDEEEAQSLFRRIGRYCREVSLTIFLSYSSQIMCVCWCYFRQKFILSMMNFHQRIFH